LGKRTVAKGKINKLEKISVSLKARFKCVTVPSTNLEATVFSIIKIKLLIKTIRVVGKASFATFLRNSSPIVNPRLGIRYLKVYGTCDRNHAQKPADVPSAAA
jgi:hypothetical protein